jgi:hypothetical protein
MGRRNKAAGTQDPERAFILIEPRRKDFDSPSSDHMVGPV